MSRLWLRRSILALALVGFAGAGATNGGCPGPVVSVVVTTPGFEDPNTPGAAGVVAPPIVSQLLGPDPDLNVVTTIRYRAPASVTGGADPRIVVIFIPGFLGGAATFAPLAEEFVTEMGGAAEVWAVDRRPNLFEDRRGSIHAQAGTEQALEEGAQFYFPETASSDIDEDGVVDPPFTLPDAFDGTARGFLLPSQDELRPIMSSWGVDVYMRDWKTLVDEARALVGPDGIVLFGGHSQGTTWTGLFAAYDFDPTAGVDAAFEKVDGLILLEGGGLGTGSTTVGLTTSNVTSSVPRPTNASEYQALVDQFATPGGPDVYLERVFGLLPVTALGAGAELTGIAGTFFPASSSILQRTSFGAILAVLIPPAATNRSLVGFFLDDDYSINPAFRASLGFSDDGPNTPIGGTVASVRYSPAPRADGAPRLWKDIGEAQATCPPNDPFASPGCSIVDNGPLPPPGVPDVIWGEEVEVTDIDDLLLLNFTNGNFAEWYFNSGRVFLDFAYGRDSSALGDESLLAVTQNANMDRPVLAIGGSNGLTPTEADFASYLGSIATPEADKRVFIIEGYAHLDPLTAAEGNETVPLMRDFATELLQRKLLAP